jgi:hypothetical protein
MSKSITPNIAPEAIIAWGVVDVSDNRLLDTFKTRKEAREQKSYAAKYGWVQKVVKLNGTAYVR